MRREAERDKYLAGDIRMAQRYAELDRQSLDLSGRQVDLQDRQVGLQQSQLNLQQRQLRWQREMLLTNAIIQGTQAAVGLVKAGVGVYEAFDSYSKQKEIKLEKEAREELEIQITKDILSGKTKMTKDEYGRLVYTGLSPEAEAIRTKYEEKIKADMGGMKWGNAGRATESLKQMYSDLKVSAAKMIADKTYKDVQNEFLSNLDNGIQEAIKDPAGNRSLVDQTLDEAKAWMSDEVWNIYKARTDEEIRVGRIKNEALRITQTDGIDKAKIFLDGQDLTEDQKKQDFSQAQQTNSQSVDTARTEAAAAYTKAAEARGSIRQRFDAAAGQGITNPDVREARISVARQKQTVDLWERFSRETNTMDLARLEELAPKYKEGGAYNPDYYGQELLQKDHYLNIVQRIEEMKADTSRAASSADKVIGNDINNTLDLMMSEWRSPDSGYDGRKILEFMISNEKHINPATKLKYEQELLGDPASSGEYVRLESLLKSQRPGDKASATEKMDYAQKEYDIKAALIDKRLKGATSQQLRETINGIIETESTEIVTKAFNAGQLNTGWGFVGNAARTETELLYLMNQGKLDPYLGEITNGGLGTQPLIVGDDAKVNAVMAEIGARGKTFLNDQLKAEGVTVGEGEMVEKARGDKDGSLRFSGSDGNYYRVGVRGPAGPRFVEKWNTGNKRWEPYTPKRANANGGPGYRPPAFPGDM
jgi:hypothetical protein